MTSDVNQDQRAMGVHLWDYFDAPLVSVERARSKLKHGWTIHKIDKPYGAPGGVAKFSHVLIGHKGELAKLTDQSVRHLAVPYELSQMVTLNSVVLDVTALVPRDAVAEARNKGAAWVRSAVGRQMMLCIRPKDKAKLGEWVPGDALLGETNVYSA